MRRKSTEGFTPKEEELMQLLWEFGPIQISKLVDRYPEPKPHFNTVSTVMRRLESKGYVGHKDVGGTFHYYAIAEKDDFRKRSLGNFVKKYFGGSYFGAVSTLVAEEKISADELKELLELIERKGK